MVHKKITFFILILMLVHLNSFSQAKYWIKKNDVRIVQDVLQKEAINCSDWLAFCTFELTHKELKVLQKFHLQHSIVQQFIPQTTHEISSTLGFALEQVKAEHFISKGLNGKGVKIGIIDGGFLGADKNESLTHFFQNGQIKYYKDYVTPDLEIYGGVQGLDDNHGTEVWQLIGGNHPEKNILYGLATAADVYLARTDHGAYEKRIEEDLLIQALEDMDSMGVKLVNISLGYNLGFTNASENYSPDQMDGQTSKLAQAVDYAAQHRGMLIVVAAGNEGSLKWQTLSTPGDAKYALTVGSSKQKVWDKIDYSSIGPDYTDFVKPDISVYSTQGTSFSTPVVTGMAACIWQLDSTLTNFEIIQLFQKAGNFYPYPNNYLGYGVPTCDEILKVYHQQPREMNSPIHTTKEMIKITVPKEVKYTVVFHKKDSIHVLHRVIYRQNGKLKVKKPEGTMQSSILLDQKVTEIFWE